MKKQSSPKLNSPLKNIVSKHTVPVHIHNSNQQDNNNIIESQHKNIEEQSLNEEFLRKKWCDQEINKIGKTINDFEQKLAEETDRDQRLQTQQEFCNNLISEQDINIDSKNKLYGTQKCQSNQNNKEINSNKMDQNLNFNEDDIDNQSNINLYEQGQDYMDDNQELIQGEQVLLSEYFNEENIQERLKKVTLLASSELQKSSRTGRRKKEKQQVVSCLQTNNNNLFNNEQMLDYKTSPYDQIICKQTKQQQFFEDNNIDNNLSSFLQNNKQNEGPKKKYYKQTHTNSMGNLELISSNYNNQEQEEQLEEMIKNQMEYYQQKKDRILEVEENDEELNNQVMRLNQNEHIEQSKGRCQSLYQEDQTTINVLANQSGILNPLEITCSSQQTLQTQKNAKQINQRNRICKNLSRKQSKQNISYNISNDNNINEEKQSNQQNYNPIKEDNFNRDLKPCYNENQNCQQDIVENIEDFEEVSFENQNNSTVQNEEIENIQGGTQSQLINHENESSFFECTQDKDFLIKKTNRGNNERNIQSMKLKNQQNKTNKQKEQEFLEMQNQNNSFQNNITRGNSNIWENNNSQNVEGDEIKEIESITFINNEQNFLFEEQHLLQNNNLKDQLSLKNKSIVIDNFSLKTGPMSQSERKATSQPNIIEQWANFNHESDRMQRSLMQREFGRSAIQFIKNQAEKVKSYGQAWVYIKQGGVLSSFVRRYAILTQYKPKNDIIGIEIPFFNKRFEIKCENSDIAYIWSKKLQNTADEVFDGGVKIEKKEFFRYYNEDMMTEQDFKKVVETGDVILFETDNVGAILQRKITGSRFDHVGVVVKFSKYDIRIFDANCDTGVSLLNWDQFIYENDLYMKVAYRRLVYDDKSQIHNVLMNLMGGRAMVLLLLNYQKKKSLKPNKYCAGCPDSAYGDILSNQSLDQSYQGSSNKKPNRVKEQYFCSEIVAKLYKRAGLLPKHISSCQYWPVSFTVNKNLVLLKGAKLGPEVNIVLNKHRQLGSQLLS